MNQQFLFNLSLCLAHTLTHDAAQVELAAGFLPGTCRNDMGTTYNAPDPAKVSADTLLAEEQAMLGTGKFAGMGPLPDMIQRIAPQYTAINLQSTADQLNGVNGAPGMLSMYEHSIQPAQAAVQTAQRTADIADVQRLGPQEMAAMRSFNPTVTGTIDTLNNQAQQKLALNGALDPFTKTALQQDVRNGQAARGMGTGYSDAAAEGYYQDATRQQRQQQATDQATRAATFSAGYYQDPFSAILNRSNPNATMAAFAQGASGAQNAQQPVMQSLSANNPMFSQVYAAQNQANAYGASSQNNLMGGLIGGGFGMLGGLGGGLFSGAGAAGGFGKLF